MSTFSVEVKRILAIEPHPNADSIEFAVIEEYRSIVRKDEYSVGDLVVYLPLASILPEWVLKRLNFWDYEKNIGKLAGPNFNRISAARIRGGHGQGICFSLSRNTEFNTWYLTDQYNKVMVVKEGDDVTEIMGVIKYHPPIPVSMEGVAFSVGYNCSLNFDVEEYLKYPNILQEGEEVIFTEKIHGTCTAVTVLPYNQSHPDAFGKKKNILIASKELLHKGLSFKNCPENKNNVYVLSTEKLIEEIDIKQENGTNGPATPIYILGETYGDKVQDLHYEGGLNFRIFGVAEGYRSEQKYLNWVSVRLWSVMLKIESVPLLYRGPFSKEIMKEYTDGKTTLGGKHIREGIVMTPIFERTDPLIGRVCLKSVSENYIHRKNGTEYN